MASGPFTEAEKQQLVELHAERKSLTEIAKLLGRGKGTISKYAEEVGVSFDTKQTAAATQSSKDRAADVRARLELKLLAKAEAMLDSISEEDGDARAAKDLMAAVSYAVNGSLKITSQDSAGKDDDQAPVDEDHGRRLVAVEADVVELKQARAERLVADVVKAEEAKLVNTMADMAATPQHIEAQVLIKQDPDA